MELGGGGSARRHHQGRHARAKREADSEEAGGTFIEAHVHDDLGVREQRDGERAGPRAGGEDRVTNPGTDELVDERGAELRL
jgi:hypothetical protein